MAIPTNGPSEPGATEVNRHFRRCKQPAPPPISRTYLLLATVRAAPPLLGHKQPKIQSHRRATAADRARKQLAMAGTRALLLLAAAVAASCCLLAAPAGAATVADICRSTAFPDLCTSTAGAQAGAAAPSSRAAISKWRIGILHCVILTIHLYYRCSQPLPKWRFRRWARRGDAAISAACMLSSGRAPARRSRRRSRRSR